MVKPNCVEHVMFQIVRPNTPCVGATPRISMMRTFDAAVQGRELCLRPRQRHGALPACTSVHLIQMEELISLMEMAIKVPRLVTRSVPRREV